METVIPLIMAKIIDRGISNYDLGYVLRTGLLMVFITVFSLICGALGGRFSSLAAFGFSRNLRRKVFHKIQSFSFSQMDFFGTGTLITRSTTDITNLQNMYQNLIRSLVRSPLMLVCGTIMACFINGRLAMLFFITIPFLSVVLCFIAVKAYPRFKLMFEKYDTLNTIVQENLIAIRVVKAFVRGEYENEKFEKVAEELREAQYKAEKVVVTNIPVMQLVIYSCIVATLWFGGNLVLKGQMKTGELVSFLTYVTQILMSLMMLSMIFVQFVLSRASYNRVLEVLDEIEDEPYEAELQSKAENHEASVKSGYSIEFNDVSFSYDGNPDNCVLSHINLKIEAGQTVGIIGGTGSSKTTLVSLIPGLYKCTSGSIKVAGRDLTEYSHKEIRRAVGFVLQKNVLFSGTIAENLRWGNEAATDTELETACRASDAHDFVSCFPDGYNSKLEQGGVNLSGGQKQRLCIARALLKKPEILILDDSTSAVDTATDLRIRQAIREWLPGTTKLIIAQRIASIQDCDLIVVMDDGKINGTGTHSQLLKSNSIYKEVFESQMSREQG